MKPTKWFAYHNISGVVISVARWYRPGSLKTEINNHRAPGWVYVPIFMDLNTDPSWREISEAEADAFIAKWKSKAESLSS